MKFWQKTYIITLILVSATLVLSGAMFLQIARSASFQAQTDKFLERQHYIALRFVEDASAVLLRKPAALAHLAENYEKTQKTNGTFLCITHGDKTLASKLPIARENVPLAPEEGQRTHAVRTANGQHYFVVTAKLPLNSEPVIFTCAFSIESFYAQWQNTTQLIVLLGTCVIAFLALVLFFVMRSLSRPLEQLASIATQWANGNYAVRSGKRTNDEIGLLATTLDNMAEKVAQNVAMLENMVGEKQQLVDNLSHELRTPLTAVRGYAEYIQRTSLTEEETLEATNYIITEASRLASMSEQLLQMAALRDEQAKQLPVCAQMLLQNAARSVSVKALECGVCVRVVCPAQCTLYGEAPLLESLLINLADNAVKSCQRGGEVQLCAQQAPNGVCITVTDNGTGMDDKTLNNLGDAFFRPDKARSRQDGGAGLGLALCRSIAAAHGTALQFTSAVGEGTSVSIFFTNLQQH